MCIRRSWLKKREREVWWDIHISCYDVELLVLQLSDQVILRLWALEKELHHQLSWFSGWQTDWIMPPAWCCRLWDSLDSIIAWASSCKSPLIYLPVYPTSSVSLRNSNTSISIHIFLHILISYIHKVLGNLPLWEHPSTHYRCVLKYFIGHKFIPVSPWDLMQQMNKIFGQLSISIEFLEGCDFKGY